MVLDSLIYTDTTTIQFVSRKNGAGVSFDMLESAGSTYTFEDSSIATQSATVLAQPKSNPVRLGFLFQPCRFRNWRHQRLGSI